MKPLKTQLNRHGHHLKQIWRNQNLALYERSKSETAQPHELEFIRIQIASQLTLPNGKIVFEHERYPSDSEWGKIAWSWPIKAKTFLLDLLKTENSPLQIRDKVRIYLNDLKV